MSTIPYYSSIPFHHVTDLQLLEAGIDLTNSTTIRKGDLVQVKFNLRDRSTQLISMVIQSLIRNLAKIRPDLHVSHTMLGPTQAAGWLTYEVTLDIFWKAPEQSKPAAPRKAAPVNQAFQLMVSLNLIQVSLVDISRDLLKTCEKVEQFQGRMKELQTTLEREDKGYDR